ncbi:MAG: N-acetyl-gamma-glutamyl-phosphate reductase, partial [Bacteroidetes bacterium]
MRVRAGIVGGTGYTAGELLQLLVHHPQAEVAWVLSRSEAGRPVAAVHDALVGLTDLTFCESIPDEEVDVVFLCLPHGAARPFLQDCALPPAAKIIDLSRDHRLAAAADGFVYGLPEWQADRIAAATRVANPGCFATALQLALLPLARAGLLTDEVHVHALTGATGAGRTPAP